MQLSEHFKNKRLAQCGMQRQNWFLNQFKSFSDALEAFDAKTENTSWLALFKADVKSRPALADLQRQISDKAIIRKAIAEQYVAGGTDELGELDSYRYAFMRNLLLGAAD